MFTAEQIQELADAAWYALEDMGADGQSVCAYTKAKLRIAYEPFLQAEMADPEVQAEPMDMPLEKAQQLVNEVDAGR